MKRKKKLSQNTGLIALVPARSSSERVKGKNVRPLGGVPLIGYTIAQARASGIFESIIVSTDSEDIGQVAVSFGAELLELRPRELATHLSPDIEWVDHVLKGLEARNRVYRAFSILRPTSPFRNPTNIEKAWRYFKSQVGVDSLRAVERCSQHPGKMWIIRNKRLLPLLPFGETSHPWHSSQVQSLPEIYVQNASLEIAWVTTVREHGNISGSTMLPWLTDGSDGFDINTEDDWDNATMMLANNPKLITEEVRDILTRCRSTPSE